MTEEVVEFPITGELDLHTFRPNEARPLVSDYLAECLARDIYRVRIIHGRGKGALRATVRAVLAKHPRVVNFGDAPPQEGGWGVTWAELSGKED